MAESTAFVDGAHAEAPSGLIAMLFTDVEGSTRLASALGDEWPRVLGAYHQIVSKTVGSAGGWVDGTAGDGFFVTFGDVAKAGRAAVEIQRRLHAHQWPPSVGELKVRMGLHVGQVERRRHGYVGLEIHRAARVGAAAHGGQLLLTGVAAELVGEAVPSQPLGAHRLKDFPAPIALYCAVIDGRGAGDFPPPRTLELRVGSVPIAPMTLIGRDGDLARLRTALLGDGERLVTVLGRGGMGKTSLALAAANDLFEEYEGGVWWIDATQARDATALCAAIGRGCRSSGEGSTKQALVADLAARGRLLLVIDNLEGVTDAGELLDSLLQELPEVRVLGTSQLPLRSRRERRLQLDRLDEPDALALLARTAERLEIPLELDSSSAELVSLLDGLPLAIELAAGRLRLFRPAELVRRLRESTAILQDRSRPDRHQSLAAALDWTLSLLGPEARELFVRIGVFAGPVELEDIELVVGENLDVISCVEILVDAALVHRVETGDGRLRFGFPEAIRQEAARLLRGAGGEPWYRAHAVWQRDLVWPLRIYEIGESRLVERAHGVAAETQAALAWAWEADRALGREIALGRFALAGRAGAFHEARSLLELVLGDPGEDPQVIDLAREHALIFRAGADLDPDQAGSLIALLPELRDLYARYLCMMNAAISLTWAKRFDEALAWNERAMELGRKIGPLAQAALLMIRADTLLEAGRGEEAEAAIAESGTVAGHLRSPQSDMTEVLLAWMASLRGAHPEAFDRYARMLTHAELVGDRSALLTTLFALVRAFSRAGRDEELLQTAGMAFAEAAEQELSTSMFAEHAAAVAAAIGRLGDAGRASLEAGRAVEPAQRVKRLCALIYAT